MNEVYTRALDYLLRLFPKREFWLKHSGEVIVVVDKGNGSLQHYGPIYSNNGSKRTEKAVENVPDDLFASVEINEGVFDARKQRRKV